MQCNIKNITFVKLCRKVKKVNFSGDSEIALRHPALPDMHAVNCHTKFQEYTVNL